MDLSLQFFFHTFFFRAPQVIRWKFSEDLIHGANSYTHGTFWRPYRYPKVGEFFFEAKIQFPFPNPWFVWYVTKFQGLKRHCTYVYGLPRRVRCFKNDISVEVEVTSYLKMVSCWPFWWNSSFQGVQRRMQFSYPNSTKFKAGLHRKFLGCFNLDNEFKKTSFWMLAKKRWI